MSRHALSLFRPPSGPGLAVLVRNALDEDIGSGDVSGAIFSPREIGFARIVAKQDGVLSGVEVVDEVFRQLAPRSEVRWKARNGQSFRRGAVLAEVSAPMPALLAGERTALNFLQRLCAIATLSREFSARLKSAASGQRSPRVYDTRKTTPGLRFLEKLAVSHGGSKNHRFALHDMAMLKNNHLDAAGGVAAAVRRLEETGFFRRKPQLSLCIEARSLGEALEALENRADIVMLDNMDPKSIRKAAVALRQRSKALKIRCPEIEISGGVNLRNLRRYAALPIDRISVGALTHSAGALDIAMRFGEADSAARKKAPTRMR
jgi:nicotinate-nucleotide pyrophosphorylase (carboxylating)